VQERMTANISFWNVRRMKSREKVCKLWLGINKKGAYKEMISSKENILIYGNIILEWSKQRGKNDEENRNLDGIRNY
jgi:hypothetical protein